MTIKSHIKKSLRKIGYDITKYQFTTHSVARLGKLLDVYKINLVFDVGANVGQYGMQLRELGYKKRIISFEPLTSAYDKLIQHSNADNLWDTINIGLGNQDTTCDINIAGNSFSSSIRNMLDSHIQAAPHSKYLGKEKIQLRKLDSVINDFISNDDNIFLKMDTQGYEKNVLDGAEKTLAKINTIQLEMSLTPLYEGETLFPAMLKLLLDKNFSLVSIQQGFSDPKTGELLQIDCIFHRSSAR